MNKVLINPYSSVTQIGLKHFLPSLHTKLQIKHKCVFGDLKLSLSWNLDLIDSSKVWNISSMFCPVSGGTVDISYKCLKRIVQILVWCKSSRIIKSKSTIGLRPNCSR